MNLEEIKETETWSLYQKGKKFLDLRDLYSRSDKNFRFYIGDQWNGLKLSKSVEPICYNFIKQIVKQKVSVVTKNLFAINYSPENIENEEFANSAQEVCKVLNKKASNVYDKDKLDSKVRRWAKKCAIYGEAVCYIYLDENGDIVNEVLNNTDVMYGDENCSDIQKQPYILIRTREDISDVIKLAKDNNLSQEDIELITGDKDTQDNAGDDGKIELNDKTWLITKLWRDEDGDIHYQQVTRYVIIVEDEDMGVDKYPLAHMNWEDVEGNARGIGEVEQHIPNQLECNKTALRRAITIKNTAYPQKVINIDAIQNVADVNKTGSTIKFRDMGSTRASDVFMNTTPAQMSSDANNFQTELINVTKELSNTGDSTTGNIDPSTASGKAILAVQQAQTQPLDDQVIALKTFLEDIARIWFMFWKNNRKDIKIYYLDKNEMTNEENYVMLEADKNTLEKLNTSVKVDITPRGAFDKYAQELSLENMMTAGHISFEEYVNSLDTDSVMPKAKLEKIMRDRKEKQQQIAEIQRQADLLKQVANAEQNDAQNLSNVITQGQMLSQNALAQENQPMSA